MAFNIDGYISGRSANVDGYLLLNTTFPKTQINAGFCKILSQVDAGDYNGQIVTQPIKTSKDYRTRLGTDCVIFSENFSNTTLNSSIWTAPVTTMAIVCAGGFCTLNSAANMAAATVARLQSYKFFTVLGTYETYFEITASIMNSPVANNVTEWGAGICSASTAPTDGFFFRLNALGQFICVATYNGIEITSDNLNFNTLINTNIIQNFLIGATNDFVKFWIDDVLVAELDCKNQAPTTSSASSLPLFARTYNTAITTSGQKIKIGQVSVAHGNQQTSKPFGHIMCGLGQMANQAPSNWGATIGRLPQLAISANPAASALSKTAANLATGLGGAFLATIAGALDANDQYAWIVSSYQVPPGTSVLPGKTLYITGIKIDTFNEGATNGANVLTWQMICAYGATQVDPLNGGGGETAIAKLSRNITLGVQSLPAASVVGVQASPTIFVDFKEGPIVVQQGEFIQTLIKFINYTNTSSQALWIYITFTGYWE